MAIFTSISFSVRSLVEGPSTSLRMTEEKDRANPSAYGDKLYILNWQR